MPLTNWVWEERQREKIRASIRSKIRRDQRAALDEQFYKSLTTPEPKSSEDGDDEGDEDNEEDIDEEEADYEATLENSLSKPKKKTKRASGKPPKVTDREYTDTFDKNLLPTMAPAETKPRGKKTVNLMTTVAAPVFDMRNSTNITVRVLVKNVWVEQVREIRTAKLLGVAGIDVPIKEIVKLTPAYKVIIERRQHVCAADVLTGDVRTF